MKDIESHREQIQKNLIDVIELKHVLLNAQVDFEHVSTGISIFITYVYYTSSRCTDCENQFQALYLFLTYIGPL